MKFYSCIWIGFFFVLFNGTYAFNSPENSPSTTVNEHRLVQNAEKSLSRRKRYLAFPEGASLTVRCIIITMFGRSNKTHCKSRSEKKNSWPFVKHSVSLVHRWVNGWPISSIGVLFTIYRTKRGSFISVTINNRDRWLCAEIDEICTENWKQSSIRKLTLQTCRRF